MPQRLTECALAIRLFLALCVAAIAGAMPARAQTGPVIVIPGKVGVPVIINGVIADGAIVYGDWGLARPGHGELVIEGPVAFAAPWDERGYFPATGHKPRVGRLEVELEENPSASDELSSRLVSRIRIPRAGHRNIRRSIRRR